MMVRVELHLGQIQGPFRHGGDPVRRLRYMAVNAMGVKKEIHCNEGRKEAPRGFNR